VPSFAGYACTYSTLGEIDGFRGLCGRAGGLSVYWRDDSLEVFYPRGGLDTDKELSGDRDTETHLRDLAATAEGRDKLRSAFGVASDEEVLAKVQEGAAAALSALHAAGIAHGDVRLANFICTQSAPAHVQLVDFGYAVDLAFATREALPGIEELEAAVDFTRKAKDADKPVRAILQKIVAAPTADAAQLLAKDQEDLARALDSLAATLRRAPETSSGAHFNPGPGGSDSDSDYDSDEDDLVVAAHAISAILANEIDRYDTREE